MTLAARRTHPPRASLPPTPTPTPTPTPAPHPRSPISPDLGRPAALDRSYRVRRGAGDHPETGLDDGFEQLGRPPDHRALGWRLGSHLLLAALPLLAISAHVFDLIPMHLTAGLVVIPLLVAIVIASLWRPLEQDRVLLRAAIVGAIATAVYDTIRLDTVYLLGWWGDFIPSIGAWILNTDHPTTGLVTDPAHQPGLVEVVVGYGWRYAGDGGGIGIWFAVLAAALRLRDRGPAITITAAVTFAVAPVWAGLIGTVALAPRAPELMFPVAGHTIALSLLGHLIFGLVLGIGTVRADRLERLWPWPPPPIPGLPALLDQLQRRAQRPTPTSPPLRASDHNRVAAPAGWSAAVAAAAPTLAERPGETTRLLPPLELHTDRAEPTQLLPPIHPALPPAQRAALPLPAPPAALPGTRLETRPGAAPRPAPTPPPPPAPAAAGSPGPPTPTSLPLPPTVPPLTGPPALATPEPRAPSSGPFATPLVTPTSGPTPSSPPGAPNRPPAHPRRPEPPVVWGRLSHPPTDLADEQLARDAGAGPEAGAGAGASR